MRRAGGRHTGGGNAPELVGNLWKFVTVQRTRISCWRRTGEDVVQCCGAPRGDSNPPKFRRPSKIVPNPTRLWKLLIIASFRTQTPLDVRKEGSKILKPPPVRSCFTLAMKNKLVVVINSLKVPKIKKILLYEMKFLVTNYSCLRNPWLEGYRLKIPNLSVLNWICWTPRTKFLGTPLVQCSDVCGL